MNSLSPEAFAVIEGRHSDPFHYLGFHVEGEKPVVRVFLPDAEEVVAIDEQGHCNELHRKAAGNANLELQTAIQ